jgi:hypothetical protein
MHASGVGVAMFCHSQEGSVANSAARSVWRTFAGNDFGGERVMIEFKGSHIERDVILWAVRWYVAYPISYRQIEEMMEEYGIDVDHATLNRWVLKYVPLLEQEFRVRKEAVDPSWRMGETYVRVKGGWKYYIGPSIRPAPRIVASGIGLKAENHVAADARGQGRRHG